MKHKNAEMIIAKANNTELAVFVKVVDSQNESGSYWAASSLSTLSIAENKFFLCLPKYKDICLNWLNGGESQYLSSGMDKWINFGDSTRWSNTHLFMTTECELRIKPKKEKRWIAYSTDQKRLGCLTFDSEVEASNHYIHEVDEPQFIEIEVEV